MLALLPPLDGRRVLDLACGTGRYARLAASRGAGEIVAADFSAAMLARLEGALRVRAGLEDLPFRADYFDCVISGLAIGHASNLEACLAGIARVLRPGASLVYSDFHRRRLACGPLPLVQRPGRKRSDLPRDGYPPAQHRAALLAAGFEIEEMRELRVGIEFTPPFTDSAEFYRRHQGVPLVLLVRARRKS